MTEIPQAETLIFTPRTADGKKRFHWTISAEDYAKIENKGRTLWQAEVTNLLDGKRYRVRGAACSQPGCICDAVVIFATTCARCNKRKDTMRGTLCMKCRSASRSEQVHALCLALIHDQCPTRYTYKSKHGMTLSYQCRCSCHKEVKAKISDLCQEAEAEMHALCVLRTCTCQCHGGTK